MDALTTPAQALSLQLARLGRDFICTALLPDSRAQLRFIGPFQGHAVVWDMQLRTLADCRQETGSDAICPCPFIEIAEGYEGVHPVTVGLDLPIIDEPVIRKTIIMLRNYKRLKIGRIEFCPSVAES